MYPRACTLAPAKTDEASLRACGREYRNEGAKSWDTEARSQQSQKTNLVPPRNASYLLGVNTSHGIISEKRANFEQSCGASIAKKPTRASNVRNTLRASLLKVEPN
jgi:hypothetical protein